MRGWIFEVEWYFCVGCCSVWVGKGLERVFFWVRVFFDLISLCEFYFLWFFGLGVVYLLKSCDGIFYFVRVIYG